MTWTALKHAISRLVKYTQWHSMHLYVLLTKTKIISDATLKTGNLIHWRNISGIVRCTLFILHNRVSLLFLGRWDQVVPTKACKSAIKQTLRLNIIVMQESNHIWAPPILRRFWIWVYCFGHWKVKVRFIAAIQRHIWWSLYINLLKKSSVSNNALFFPRSVKFGECSVRKTFHASPFQEIRIESSEALRCSASTVSLGLIICQATRQSAHELLCSFFKKRVNLIFAETTSSKAAYLATFLT